MAPKYFNENRYSYLVASWREPANVDYQVDSPVGRFERRVHRLFLEGQRRLHQEEFALALDTFRELQALILVTADPQMPPDPHRSPGFRFPMDAALVNTLAGRAGEILRETPPTVYRFPDAVAPDVSKLPASVQQKIKPAVESELHITSFHGKVFGLVESGLAAAAKEDWSSALRRYGAALKATPAADKAVRASLLHDIAILNEKLNRRSRAEQLGRESARLFSEARVPKARAHALDTLAGVLLRGGKKDDAARAAKQAEDVRKRNNLFPVIVGPSLAPPAAAPITAPVSGIGPLSAPQPITVAQPVLLTQPALAIQPGVPTAAPSAAPAAAALTAPPPALMGLAYLPETAAVKTLTIRGADATASIVLDARAGTNVKSFLGALRATDSLDLITGFWWTPTQMVAYLPHMYFFLIPMAIGDCLAGMGNLEEAEKEYLGVLPYPFINRKYEIVRWWTRMAELYLEMGDDLYRRAKDNPAGWQQARAHYEKIVRRTGTINAASPLYKDSKLAGIRQRVTAFLNAADPLAVNDNPRILGKVLRARSRLNQIQAGLNFFGFAPDYLPPFSFEYLQNTARYFAQNAAQIEQQYIQYKSTAENEELRREQLDQQAEVARQTVVLEQRGLDEAIAGIGVAQASLDYAQTQRQNAIQSKQDFDNARWELLEYAELEAWAGAASVDEDDEIKQTISGYRYYNTTRKRRSEVLKDLAHRRTKLSHDLEAAKLQRQIDSATAYMGISQAQVAQAEARKAVAEQRVQIAQLQQRNAEENRDFLDMKEFSSRLWYELAREARRLTRRYLDMAIETAMLMERAYNAETERGLRIIRFDYGSGRTADLLAADRLRADIDYFTLDLVTTIRPKKSPVKKTISLADRRPMAFQQLKQTGRCFFQTELEDFDREHPGLYLCKLRNVELLFVGITGASSLAGSLRNVGVSKFRNASGGVLTRHYPSDVMPLSQYDLRQDALAFRVSPNDLRLFENNGIDTLWQLELPLDANDFDFGEILDVQLVIYYDGLFSPNLEAAVKAALPAAGAATRGFSMRMSFPDELFYLRNKGEAILEFSPGMFPRNQTNLKRTGVLIKVLGDAAAGLTMRLTPAGGPAELTLVANAEGEVNDATPGKPLRKLHNRSMFDTWTLRITADDNPGLVADGELDLGGLEDVLVFFEYSFDYR